MPRVVDHVAYRKELLRSCFDLFCREGFSTVTMRGIAAEIGVSTGTLYHYFPTKVAVLEQMFPWAIEEDIGRYSRKAPKRRTLSEKLDDIAAFWVGDEKHYKSLLLLALDLFRHSPAGSGKVFQAYADDYTLALRKALGIDRQTARGILFYLLGVVAHSLLAPEAFSFQDEVNVLARTLKQVLLTPSSERPREASPAAPPQRRSPPTQTTNPRPSGRRTAKKARSTKEGAQP